MRIERVVPNLTVDDIDHAKAQHAQVLGLRVIMDHGWIVMLGDEAGHQLSLLTQDATAPMNPNVSVFVDDVVEAYQRAVANGVTIVHPLTVEPWGVTRFFYQGTGGQVVNVGMHTPVTADPGESPQAAR